MLVICCGNQRCGSTLQYQMAAEILEPCGKVKRAGYINSNTYLSLPSSKNREFLIVKTHDFIPAAAETIEQGNAKAIYAYRDLRDVVVSIMNTLGEHPYSILRKGYLEYFIKVDRQWCDLRNVLISKYEEIVMHPDKEASRISDYLGERIDDLKAAEIADKFSIANQRKRIQQIDYKTIYEKSGRSSTPDPHSMLKINHIHSGKEGQWKERLSSFQVAIIEALAYKWLLSKGYEVSQPWWKRCLATAAYFLFLKLPRLMNSSFSNFFNAIKKQKG